MTAILNAGSYNYTIGTLVNLVSKEELTINSEETLSSDNECRLTEQIKRGVVFGSVIINNRNPRTRRDLHVVSGEQLLNSIIGIYKRNLETEEIDLDLIENVSVGVVLTLNEDEELIRNIIF